MKPDDLDKLRILSAPRLHPDGDVALVKVSRPNLKKDRYDSALWAFDGGEVREVPGTDGTGSFEWSPDGRKLASLEKTPDDPDAKGDDADKHAQLAIRDEPLRGGPPRVLTRFDLGVRVFRWSPRGERILVAAEVYAEGWSQLDKKERGKRPRRLTATPWRFDASSTMDDRRPRVAIVDPSGQRRPRELDLTRDGDGAGEIVGVDDVAWHPSGERVAVLARRYHAGRRNRLEDVVLEVDLATGAARERHVDGGWHRVLYAGERLVGVGLKHVFDWPDTPSLWEIPADGGEPVDLAPGFDRSLGDVRKAGDALCFLYEDGGRSCVGRWLPDGVIETIVDPAITRFTSDFDARADGTLALVVKTPTDPGELVIQRPGAEPERVTALNEDFARDAKTFEPVQIAVESGGTSIDAWVYLPEGDGLAPVLLNVHGGPATQYGVGFFDEFQVYVEAGYAVVACNPRGSSGRGRDHVQAVRGDGWGRVDQADILACLDAALARFDRLDAGRVGVMGGSYGGFMTAWLIAHSDRFKAAIVERALLSWESFSGTSDIGSVFSRMYLDADGDQAEMLRAKSPLFLASRTKTPTFVIHSEQDWRCPMEQAEQYFAALLRHGVEAEMLRFPGECHELSRSGDPAHRKARFEAILGWWKRWLGDAEAGSQG